MNAPRPRVVHVPGNEVLPDARVLKYLATMDRWGLDTYAVGVTRRGGDRDLTLGGVTVLIRSVPTPPARPTSPARRRALTTVLAAPGSDTALAEARATVRRWRSTAARRRGVRRTALRSAVLLARVWLRVSRAVVERRPRPRPEELGDGERRRAAEIARYRSTRHRVRWREELPVVAEDERVIGALLDELEPDVIHVHDVFMLGVAAESVRRARDAGRQVRLVYDAHEYIPGLAVVPARTVAAYCDIEREYIGEVDRVVTVSEPLAALLEADHHMHSSPTVVLNAPTVAAPPPGFRTVREVVGLADDVPLMVYGGGVNAARGVDTAVAALPALPGVHLAVVIHRRNHVVEALLSQAEALGVADRVHLAPFVPPELVTRYFSTVTLGLSTLLHAPNHDVAVTNKFCEYLTAGVPIVTSDTPAQADLVRELDLGAVYPAGDADALARAVQSVLADHPRLSARIAQDGALRRRFSWSAQAETIRTLYTDLLGELPAEAWRPDALDIRRVSPEDA
ncbi:glycosyltransferase family 4 protein [Cellulomonas sp. APG4]|uniref:glycosyltransferase family 4 protein n=1 Tax=Cellulomonas sp. APG4 TaxID=1538656 RepID=UPI00137ABA11|nr:glycosyltransferase family 4 protein [Cellulomonas sp. APG4]NCT91328.1 glycosyltransferase family 4 protein [Cellulomonas sp. APG4]